MAADAKAAKAASYVVTALMVTAKVGEKIVYFNRGDVLPGTVAPESIEHLLSVGLIEAQ